MSTTTHIVDARGNRFPMPWQDAAQVAKWWDEMYPREAPHTVEVVSSMGTTKEEQ